jgi:Uncharacterised protein family (UPF0139)
MAPLTDSAKTEDGYLLMAMLLAVLGTFLRNPGYGYASVYFCFASFTCMRKSTANYSQLIICTFFSLFTVASTLVTANKLNSQ